MPRRETLGWIFQGLGEKDPLIERSVWWFRLVWNHWSSGGPIGVVKLLRARGGCLGVIRIRAWKAAISPGELPNERRSRNT